jgi:hypothetical protein
MNNTNQEFDAVAMMRQIRDQLSQQFQDWTLAEQQQYIRSHIQVPKRQDLREHWSDINVCPTNLNQTQPSRVPEVGGR